ncbi:hypothetical protein KSS87_015698 [Heliosperma pusillum]|nr:hypothetical protein KSS87_015698 [Heliosperma pusillum]
MDVKVGVFIDKGSVEGKVRLSCINMAISDWYAAHPDSKTKIIIYVRDSYNHDHLAVAHADVVLEDCTLALSAILEPNNDLRRHFHRRKRKKPNVSPGHRRGKRMEYRLRQSYEWSENLMCAGVGGGCTVDKDNEEKKGYYNGGER